VSGKPQRISKPARRLCEREKVRERKSRRWQLKTLIKRVNKIKGCNLNH